MIERLREYVKWLHVQSDSSLIGYDSGGYKAYETAVAKLERLFPELKDKTLSKDYNDSMRMD